jgi:serine/threonine kinase 16
LGTLVIVSSSPSMFSIGGLTDKFKSPVNLSNLVKQKFVFEDGTRYAVLNQIGEGGFAFVYRVKKATVLKTANEEHFAVKKMICQLPEQIEEGEKEIMILRKLQNEHVMPLLGASISKNSRGHTEILLLLPLYAGTVQTLIDNNRKGPPYCPFEDAGDILTIVRGTMTGLQALHEAGYRHGDLKPANILLTNFSGGAMKAILTDFGSCAPLMQPVASRQEALNIQDHAASNSTASIRAPELFDTPSSGVTISGQADVWSLGCTFYSCLFSHTPFEDPVQGLSTLAVLSGTYKLHPGHPFPDDWAAFIGACLTVGLHQRPGLDKAIALFDLMSVAPESVVWAAKSGGTRAQGDTVDAPVSAKEIDAILRNHHNKAATSSSSESARLQSSSSSSSSSGGGGDIDIESTADAFEVEDIDWGPAASATVGSTDGGVLSAAPPAVETASVGAGVERPPDPPAATSAQFAESAEFVADFGFEGEAHGEDDDDEEFGDFTAVKRDSMEIPPAPASGPVEISQEEDRESYLSRVSAFDPSFCGDDDDDAAESGRESGASVDDMVF